MSEAFCHIPIMVEDVLRMLEPQRGGVYVDGTLGGGGHAEEVLKRLPKGGLLVGIDRDGAAIQAASERLGKFGESFRAIRGNFFEMPQLLAAEGIEAVDGVLLDLGVSSHQLDAAERGFSFHAEAPLDMRMDNRQGKTAEEVVNTYSFEDLARILREYGEERYAGKLASAIVNARNKKRITTTVELAEIIKAATPPANRYQGQHPARRTFQAVRIEVNGELAGLEEALRKAFACLRQGGKMAVISFHSLEDRTVKQLFREWEQPCVCPPKAPVCTCGRKPEGKLLNKKPITAGTEETELNPRSKSAKLRGIERI